MPREDYQERREARIDRLEARAEKLTREAESRSKAGWDALHQIPFGQPILVGHHSEKRDRNYRARATGNIDKAAELDREARECSSRAAAAEDNTSISSDDPEAVARLKKKLASLEAEREEMKAINKAYRAYKKKPESLEKAKLSEYTRCAIRAFKPEYSWQKGPVESYQLSNLGATIRSTKKRIVELEAEAGAESKTYTVGAVEVEESTDLNRVLIRFDLPGQPIKREVSQAMRSHGFRWTPSETAWTAKLNGSSRWKAGEAAKRVDGILSPKEGISRD